MQDGTAGAVNLARPHVKEPVLIIFVDTVFEADLTLINRTDADGIIWAKEVEDYQRFGVVVTDREGFMTRIVEKPSEPVSKLGQHRALLHPRHRRALARHRSRARVACQQGRVLPDRCLSAHDRAGEADPHRRGGRLVRLRNPRRNIETNHTLLQKGGARRPALPESVTVREPVHIEEGVTIERSTIGPNVTIEKGSKVVDSRLEHTLVGRNCRITRATLKQSLLGDDVELRDVNGMASLGDHAELYGVPD